jgi:hypothetical protein
VSVWEQRLRVGRCGVQVRPFCVQAQIQHKAYSLALQRVLTDFGADGSFATASYKAKEHYGIEIPISGARQQTLRHAKAIAAVEHEPPKQPVKTLITETDGCMLPIVTPATDPQVDHRKGKQLSWREARLCLSRSSEAVDSVYGASFGTPKVVGWLWRQTACAAGLGAQSQVHGLGDGAEWILNTFEEQFGAGQNSQAHFTIDFHHISDYLAAAALVIAPQSNKDWLHEQQTRLRQNRVEEVLSILSQHLEDPEQKETPVRSAYQYINKRREHLDYAGALAAGLPIGSGEVESGHRHVLQQRLKIAGAWWLERNAESMLQLRAVRASKDWENYWSQLQKN